MNIIWAMALGILVDCSHGDEVSLNEVERAYHLGKGAVLAFQIKKNMTREEVNHLLGLAHQMSGGAGYWDDEYPHYGITVSYSVPSRINKGEQWEFKVESVEWNPDWGMRLAYENIQGEWTVVRAEASGSQASSAYLGTEFIFGPTTLVRKIGQKEQHGTYQLGVTGRRTIDVNINGCRSWNGKKWVYLLDSWAFETGIFKFQEQQLVLCITRIDDTMIEKKDRPTDFSTKKGDDRLLLTLRRKSP